MNMFDQFFGHLSDDGGDEEDQYPRVDNESSGVYTEERFNELLDHVIELMDHVNELMAEKAKLQDEINRLKETK